MDSLLYKESFDQRLRDTLRRIQFSTKLTEGQFRDILQLNKSDFERFWLGELEVGLSSLAALSQQLSISIDLIFSGNIDYRTLASQNHSNLIALPEKYLKPEHQIALKTSLQGAFEYMVRFHGKNYTESILRRLQVNPDFFYVSGDEFISPVLQADFFNSVEKDGFSTDVFYDMGSYTLHQLKIQLKKKQIEIPKQTDKLYERFFLNQFGYSDLFFEYKINKLEKNRCIFEIIHPPIKESSLEEEIKKFTFSCQFKIGMISSLTTLIRRKKARFRKTSCWFRGDPSCKFELTWEDVIPMNSSYPIENSH